MVKFRTYLCMVAFLALLSGSAIAQTVTSVDWVYLSSQHKVYDSSLVDQSGSGANGWVFQLVVDMDGDTQYSSIAGLSSWDPSSTTYDSEDDVVIDTASWNTAFGIFESGSTFANTYGGKELYVRFFDTATPTPGSSNMGIAYDTGNEGIGNTGTWVAPSAADPAPTPLTLQVNPDSLAYVAGTDNSGGLADGYATTIAYVPEPGTMALFALGAVTLGVGYRRKKS